MVFEPISQLGHKKIKYSSSPAFHIEICTVPDCPVSDMLMQFRKLAGSVATDCLIYDYLSAPTVRGIVEYSRQFYENHD